MQNTCVVNREVYRYLIILTRKSGKAGMKAAPGAQSDPEIYITELGQVYDY